MREQLHDHFQNMLSEAGIYRNYNLSFVDFQIQGADFACRRGEPTLATSFLDESPQMLKDLEEKSNSLMIDVNNFGFLLEKARFVNWKHTGQILDPADDAPESFDNEMALSGCHETYRAAHSAIMRGNIEEAQWHTNYSIEKGFRALGFLRFCKEYGLCPGSF